MRTMRGNCFTKGGIMVLVWDRVALFTKVIGQRLFETVHHIKSLYSATLSSPAFRATLWTFSISLIFYNRDRGKIYL